MNPEYAGWLIAIGLFSLVAGAVVQKVFLRSNCETCGMTGLQDEVQQLKDELLCQLNKHHAEMVRLSNLVRALAERAGMTVKEQLEFDRLETK